MADDQPTPTGGIDRRTYLSAAAAAATLGAGTGVTRAGGEDDEDSASDSVTEIDSEMTITEPGTYVLTDDIEVEMPDIDPEAVNEEGVSVEELLPDQMGLTVEADDVVIEGEGATITGPFGEELQETGPLAALTEAQADTGTDTFGPGSALTGTATSLVQAPAPAEVLVEAAPILSGITIPTEVERVTVRDATIEGFREGISVSRQIGGEISNVLVRNNEYGIILRRCREVSISDCTAVQNRYGFYISIGGTNSITTSDAVNNGTGLGLFNSDGNFIGGTTRLDDNGRGLSIERCANTLFRGSASDNESDGIRIFPNPELGDRSLFPMRGPEESRDNTFASATLTNNGDAGISLGNVSRDLVVNSEINGNGTGIRLLSPEDVRLEGNELVGNDYGIAMGGGENTTITGNRIFGTRLEGPEGSIGVFANETRGDEITGNLVREAQVGIAAESPRGLRISNDNRILANEEEGIRMADAQSVTVTDNIIINNGASGIGMDGAEDTTIANNQLSQNLNGMSVVDGQSGLTIGPNNRATENDVYGIILSGNVVEVTDNALDDNGNTGIFLFGARACEITENTANRNGNYGVDLIASVDNTVTDNVLFGNGIAPFPPARTAGNTFANNRISRPIEPISQV